MHRRLVILGSGELAPPMVKTYRRLFEGRDSQRGVYLDSPYGFQENVPQLNEKIEQYFATSLQWHFTCASLTHRNVEDQLSRATFQNSLNDASVIFAGPGSPTYALRQFHEVHLGDTLRSRLIDGTLVCFSSAAALTLGSHTAPIYEIYKVGEEPAWREGLDVLGLFGLQCAVIPHYDNAEGGNHDTRYCYLGATRMRELEKQLPSDVSVLGVDEHTAVILSLDNDDLTVEGRGHAYWRIDGVERRLENGSTTSLDELRHSPRPASPPIQTATSEAEETSLFDLILGGGDRGARALEQVLRRAERGAPGLIDPAPLVERLLVIRATARANGLYDISDQIRDALTSCGIEIKDSPAGTTWSLIEGN